MRIEGKDDDVGAGNEGGIWGGGAFVDNAIIDGISNCVVVGVDGHDVVTNVFEDFGIGAAH